MSGVLESVDPVRVGGAFNVSVVVSLISESTSVSSMFVSNTFPVFSTAMKNVTVSPTSGISSPSRSVKVYVFVTSSSGSKVSSVIVGSSTVLPSVSIPSSLTSNTLVALSRVIA